MAATAAAAMGYHLLRMPAATLLLDPLTCLDQTTLLPLFLDALIADTRLSSQRYRP
jgi:hypothetical protein